MKLRLHTYTNNMTSEVIFTVATQNLYGADKMFEAMLGVHPSKLNYIGLEIKPTNLPEGCLVGSIGDPARALRKSAIVKETKKRSRKKAILVALGTPYEGQELSKDWSLFKLGLPRDRKREFCNACSYCGIELTKDTTSRDHIYPRCLGGKVLVLSCRTCNTFKGSLLVSDFRMRVFGEGIDNEFFCEFAMRTGSSEYQFTGRNR